MKVELSDRAHREMQRIDVSWRKHADFPELFLDELLQTVELIETTGVLGAPYNVKAKHRVSRLLMGNVRQGGPHCHVAGSSRIIGGTGPPATFS